MENHVATPPTAGLTRRQLLQRSAVVGGSILVTQSLGTVAAYAQTSSPPPPPEPPVHPPTDPPVDPPTDPPTDPPVDPPTDPPVDPPTDPPADPGTPGSAADPGTPRAAADPGAPRPAAGQSTGTLPVTGAPIPWLTAAGVTGIAAGTALVKARPSSSRRQADPDGVAGTPGADDVPARDSHRHDDELA